MPLAAALSLALAAAGPTVFEVRPGDAPLADHGPAFVAARFRVRGGAVERGPWLRADEILGPGKTPVIVAASWCPACHRLLEKLSARRPAFEGLVVFLDDENERLVARRRASQRSVEGRALFDPASLERYPLDLWLLDARSSSIPRMVTHYPFRMLCTRTRCEPAR